MGPAQKHTQRDDRLTRGKERETERGNGREWEREAEGVRLGPGLERMQRERMQEGEKEREGDRMRERDREM